MCSVAPEGAVRGKALSRGEKPQTEEGTAPDPGDPHGGHTCAPVERSLSVTGRCVGIEAAAGRHGICDSSRK